MADLDPTVRELLDGPNFVTLATLREGAPHATVVWAAIEDGRPALVECVTCEECRIPGTS